MSCKYQDQAQSIIPQSSRLHTTKIPKTNNPPPHSKTFHLLPKRTRPYRPNLPHTNKPLSLPRPLLKNPLPNHSRQGALKYLQCLPHLRRRQRSRTLLLCLLRPRSPHSSYKRYNLRQPKRNTSLQRHTPTRSNGKRSVGGSNELHR